MLAVRGEVRQVVPVGGGAQQVEQQAVGVVTALQVVCPHIDVRDVGAELEVVGHAVRSVEPHRRALVQVVRADKNPAIAQVRAGEVERRPVVATRHRQIVIGRVAGGEGLVGVVVGRAGDPRPPAGPASEIADARRAVAVARGRPAQPLTPHRLQRIGVVDVVRGDRAAQRVVGGTGFAVLGRDQHDALACA